MRAYVSSRPAFAIRDSEHNSLPWHWISLVSILFICLVLSACESTPTRPFAESRAPGEFLDYAPLEAGVLQRVGLNFAYEVEQAPSSKPHMIIYYLDLASGQKQALAAIKIDGIVVNDYARKSMFAISWDEKKLLYMHDQTDYGPDNLRIKPPGLYEYVVGRGDQLIHGEARIISHSTFQLARNAIEFALGDPNDYFTEHYVRSTEGFEFAQEEAFVMQHGGTELHRAAVNGDIDRAMELVGFGLELEARDNRGFTPLHAAIWESQEEMAKFLIEQGANVDARILGAFDWSAIEAAARFGLLATLELLLEKDANINSRTFKDETPLHLAIDYKNYRAAELLIDSGADVNAITNNGSTALHLFSKLSRDERSDTWQLSSESSLLKAIIENQDNLGAKDVNGGSVLQYAVLKNNLRTAQALIDIGADASAMELPNVHFIGDQFHHKGSEMTLRQRMDDTFASPWWTQGET